MTSNKKYERIGIRYISFITGIFCCVLLIICLSWSIYLIFKSPQWGMSAVIIENPVKILWWDSSLQKMILISIPSDYVPGGSESDSVYSLEALWKLDYMGSKRGSLITQALLNTFGLPIEWYVHAGEDTEMEKGFSTVSHLKKVLSPFDYILSFGHSQKTNIPFISRLSFWRILLFLRDDQLKVIDISGIPVTKTRILADGSPVSVIDPDSVERYTTSYFEITDVRKEAIPVAVYNATNVSGLGERVSKILNRIGMLVVAVGNTEETRSSCLIKASHTMFHTQTAQILLHMFHCEKEEVSDVMRADIVLLIGNNFIKDNQ